MILVITTCGLSCKKQNEFLDKLPDQALTTFSKLSDLQLLLQNEAILNVDDPSLDDASADDYFVSDAYFITMTTDDQNMYRWNKTIYQPNETINDWNSSYNKIYIANTVLDQLSSFKYSSDQQMMADNIKGEALFFRAKSYYRLLQIFVKPYSTITAKTDMGVPLRLTSDFNTKVGRGNVQQDYEQVIQDLKQAIALLPAKTSVITQPTKLAATGWLARVYLSMGDYANAFSYADTYLQQNSALDDYNNFNPKAIPFTAGPLVEDIFLSTMSAQGNLLVGSQTQVDSNLYRSYASNDLRPGIFFRNKAGRNYYFGSYDIYVFFHFDGIATDEQYLIRAECFARQGNASKAMTDLNALLVKRFATGTFVPYTATDPQDALRQVLMERRKELCYRGLRWSDLRRLNTDPNYAVTLKRVVNGVTYTLPPNDPRYVLPIPDQEIQLNGIPQNPR